MTPRAKLQTLKALCWLGVVADAFWTAALLHPPLFEILTGRAIGPDVSVRLAMGIAASLMAGWTLLLAWASHDPIPRRGVLLLTACPVILGLAIVTIAGTGSGGASSAWILIKLVLLGGAMLAGFRMARTMATTAA